MNFLENLNKKIEIIEKNLKNYMPVTTYPEVIFESMEYSLFATGKRLRPVFLLSSFEIFSKEDFSVVMPYAVAIEMIHTYSLIHDDLPAMDDDDFRRGKPTNHKQFNEAVAILAGDGLLNLAFETMIDDSLKNGDRKFLKATSIIAKASGIRGMISGQVADIICENKNIDLETLNFIHTNKTAALIKAALCAGATLGGASLQEVEILGQIGDNIGLAFQIKDDLLDVTSTTEHLGKPVNSDFENCKTTYVNLFGIERSQQKISELTQETKQLLSKISGNTLFLYDLFEYLVARTK